jgi:VCBS repeat-containing protein
MSLTNNPPVLTSDLGSVTEDEVLTTTGNILANDTDPNGLTLFVTSVNGIAVTGTTTIVGTYGTLVIQPNGQYVYTLANTQTNVRALTNGQVIPDTFSYVVSDGQTYTQTITQAAQNLISQSEAFNSSVWVPFADTGAAPVITANVAAGPTGGASTADQVALANANSGLYYVTNVAGTSTFSVWVKLVSGSGNLSLNYYQGSTNSSILESVVATSTWQQISLTFTGDGNVNSNIALMLGPTQTATGTFEFWGAQLNSGSTIEPYVATTGSPITTTVTTTTPIVSSSTLTVDVTGNTPVTTPDTAAVTEAGTVVVTGNVLANDTDGGGKTLTVTAVNGTAVGATGTTTIVGTYGTLVIQANGQYTYTLASSQANVLALASGQVVPDAFNYTVSDGKTYDQTTTQNIQNLISQSEAFNSSVWVPFAASGAVPVVTANVAAGPTGGASTADQVALARANSGLYYVTNVAGTYTFSVWVKLVSGSGSFALNYYQGSANTSSLEAVVATGTWQQVSLTFTGDGNVNSNVALMLGPSQATAGTFEFWGAQLNPGSTIEPYAPTTGSPVTTTLTTTTPLAIGSTLTVNVTGHSSDPTANPDTAAVTESKTLVATGNILTNDIDPLGRTLSVTAVNGTAVSATGTTTIVGTYGTLVIQANGQYTYTLASNQANVLGLATGQVAPDLFNYTISDGNTYTQSTTQTAQNMISQSEAFNSSVWVAFADSGAAPVVTANVAAGPTGGASTADQVALANANSGLYYVTNVAGTYTFSVWVKLISGSGGFSLNYYQGSTNSSVLESVVATSTWQQVSLTFTGDSNVNSNIALMLGPNQTAAGTFEFWGAQLNPGLTIEPYVPTTGSPVTTTVTTTTPIVIGTTLTVDVTGLNSNPVANPDTVTVTEDETLVATGNVLTNDTDPLGRTLTVAAVNGTTVSATGSTTIVGTYGTLVIQANGQYTYTLANAQANVRALANGQVMPDAFSYTVSDGNTYTQTTTQTVQNLITQSQNFTTSPWLTTMPAGMPRSSIVLPSTLVITSNVDAGPMGGAATADELNLTGPDATLYYQTNVGGQNTFSIYVRLVSGSGTFSLAYKSAATGAINYETVVATSTWQRVSITFSGDGNAGSWVGIGYSPNQEADGVFEIWGAQLNGGATPDTYAATTGTAVNTTATTTTPVGSTLTVNVTGDTPVAVPNTAAVSVGGTVVTTGNLLANDTAPAGQTLTVATVNGIAISGTTTIVGTYGTLVVQANGAYTYTLASGQTNVGQLLAGQTVNDGFAYTVSDGQVYTNVAPQISQNLITQSEAFNVAPWVPFSGGGAAPAIVANAAAGPSGGTSTADQMTLSSAGSGIYYVANVPGEYTFSVWVKLVSGSGSFSFNYYESSIASGYLQSAVATTSWQRFTFSFLGDGDPSSNVALMHSSTQTSSSTFDFWGAQLNPGATADTYVPTSGAPATTTTPVTTTATIGSTLTVSVAGNSANQPGATLNLQNTTQALVANLATDQWSYAENVLPLGDSITYGWTDAEYLTQDTLSVGYRGPLWSDFVNNNTLINFVGDQNDGPATLPNTANAGYPGLTTNQIAARLPGLLVSQAPNAILLMAGTNDIINGVSASTIAANILGMLNTVNAFNPAIHVYVSTLTPMVNNVSSQVAPTNTAITNMVAQAKANGLNVSLVSMSDVTTADISADGAHPTDAGYALMAQNFYSAILAQQPAAGGAPGGTSNAITSSIFNLVGGSGDDVLIGNSGPNMIYAGSGNTILEGGGGIDTLVGGSGADQFFITPTAGTVTIQDFNPGADWLVWDKIPGLTSTSQLNSSVVTQSGGQTTINLASFGVNEHVVLAGYTGSLGQSQFI